MKYKKLFIVLGSVVGVILLAIILSFTLFRTSKVELNFKNQTTFFASEEHKQAVVDSGKISFSSPVFATNKKQIIQNLELCNPYLKVINIETVFPNKLIIHCAEREELFCIKISDNLYYYVDGDLKVLGVDNKHTSQAQNEPILLDDVDVLNKTAKVGEILNLQINDSLIKYFSTAFAYNNKTISDIKAMFKTVSLSYEKNYYTLSSSEVLTFTTFDDFKIKMCLPSVYMVEKVNLMLALIPECVENYSTHQLVIDINPNNVSEVYVRKELIK